MSYKFKANNYPKYKQIAERRGITVNKWYNFNLKHGATYCENFRHVTITLVVDFHS